jgi:hypothetical protein
MAYNSNTDLTGSAWTLDSWTPSSDTAGSISFSHASSGSVSFTINTTGETIEDRVTRSLSGAIADPTASANDEWLGMVDGLVKDATSIYHSDSSEITPSSNRINLDASMKIFLKGYL